LYAGWLLRKILFLQQQYLILVEEDLPIRLLVQKL
jgi:hypothetical protein